jgi:hypothetical protein
MNPDYLNADAYSALGQFPVLIVDAVTWVPPAVHIDSVIIGLDRAGSLPRCDANQFDLLITSANSPPAPWVVGLAILEDVERAIRHHPIAATIFCQTLRLGEKLCFADALKVESLAYSALLGGDEFKHWQSGQSFAAVTEPDDLLIIERDTDHVTITLDNPAQQNAVTARMRDALYGALANILDDPTNPTVSLRGAGKCFSTGGSLPEFGTARDLAQAHIVRTGHSCARLIDALGGRVDVAFHGACLGSGLEIFAAAARRTAQDNAWFQLPELRMGLIPGAGGTVTVSRAIGRHRTAWMVLSGKRIDARMARDWGLITA